MRRGFFTYKCLILVTGPSDQRVLQGLLCQLLGTIEDSETTIFFALAAGLGYSSQIMHITRLTVSKVVDTQLGPMGNSLGP